MNKIWMAGLGGAVAGVIVSTQFAGPIVAQEAEDGGSVYEQLDLFGDIFERVRAPTSRRSREGADRERDQRDAPVARPAFELSAA
jgi:carboxyl-terminal processing protease